MSLWGYVVVTIIAIVNAVVAFITGIVDAVHSAQEERLLLLSI